MIAQHGREPVERTDDGSRPGMGDLEIRDSDDDNSDVVSWSAGLEFQDFAEDGAGQCFCGVEGACCSGGEPFFSVEVFSAARLGDAVGVEQKRVTRQQADVHIVQMRRVYDG